MIKLEPSGTRPKPEVEMHELPGLLGIILADEAVSLEGWRMELVEGNLD